MLPEQQSSSTNTNDRRPDYSNLVRFLLSPLLDAPESLSIDSEESNNRSRVWIRVAFDDEEKGRVVGRGGRNLQAISTVLNAAAETAGQSVYLEIYGDERSNASSPGDGGGKHRTRRGGRQELRRQSDSAKPSNLSGDRVANDSRTNVEGKKDSSRSRPSPPKPSPRLRSE
ncbi:MAG: KH domain-containing protein [Oscillatoria sp. PMC 1068.18]|nr:KH domain-containing protein [Oscillatoria sp. PMC 1076.18]MEC4989195.1 KH domain-containing protein [Oscillatoria sp. PMC 1068.18]